MKHRDRVIQALNHKITDRPPFQTTFTPEFARRLRNNLGIEDTFPHDPHNGRWNGYNLEIATGQDALQCGIGWFTNYYLSNVPYTDEWGIRWKTDKYQTPFGEGFYTNIAEGPLKNDPDVDTYKSPDPHRPELYTNLERLINGYKSGYYIIGRLHCTIFESAWALHGFEQVMMDFYLKPGLVNKSFKTRIMKNYKYWVIVLMGSFLLLIAIVWGLKQFPGSLNKGENMSSSFYNLSAAAILTTPRAKIPMAFIPATNASFELEGYLRKRIDKSIQRYLLEIPESSPAILQVMRDRDRLPVRIPLMPWAGEFAGKYLTGAELVWRLTHDPALKETIDSFVCDLIACQESDGYLGPFPKTSRLTGNNWDVWGHYHCMLGLMHYYEDTQYEPALIACEKIADLLFETFGTGRPSLTCDGEGGQMNMAVCHGFVLLYEKTGVSRYLDMANYIVNEAWNEDGAGKYLNYALAGKSIIEFPRHRWESIHDWQVLGELYWLTGEGKYRSAMEKIWRSGVDGDRHNTGGITSGEGFTGSPYTQNAIETCCTVAWTAFSVDMLRMTGNSQVADEIEWSTFNSALGAIPYSGRACAYNVPMDGTRMFGVELPWQAPMAGPDLNCCSVNAYRPLGMISQWALMQSDEGPVVNFYGPGKMTTTMPSNNQLTITEETEYPAEGLVNLALTMKHPETFTLKLRIPFWSTNTGIKVNGKAISEKAGAGTYLAIKRSWKSGDKIELRFDFKLRLWSGDKECKGKVSVYRGPILCTYDARFNEIDPDQIPELDAASLTFDRQKFDSMLEPWVFGVLKDKTGAKILVCDFSSAGQTGNQYRSWLPLAKGTIYGLESLRRH